MNKTIYFFILFFLPVLAVAQSENMNYILSTVYKDPVGNHNLENIADSSKVESINYFDGLGRPIQSILHKQASNGNDIITPMAYDSYGRQHKQFLPYTNLNASLNYIPAALEQAFEYYSSPNPLVNGNPDQEPTENAYSRTFYERSPLNRTRKIAAPGNVWIGNEEIGDDDDHTIKKLYQFNSINEVRKFTVLTTWNGQHGSTEGIYDIALQGGTAFYDPNELFKTVTRDENWSINISLTEHTTEEFKDKQGKIILKRTYSLVDQVSVAHDTYYVYDVYGNLTFVLPPLVDTSMNIDNDILNGLCYQYKYDDKNRLAEKKDPGKQWQYIVYDKLDRIVATGPSNAPFVNFSKEGRIGWLITKYDVFNRVTITGWQAVDETVVGTLDRESLQAAYSAETVFNEEAVASANSVNGIDFFYSNVSMPTANYHILSVNYYDDYRFLENPNFPQTILNQQVHYQTTHKPKGLPTGSLVRVLQTNSDIKCELSYLLYDEKGRVIQNHKTNHLEGQSVLTSKYDFSGKIMYSNMTHKRSDEGTSFVMEDYFKYSGQDRLKLHAHRSGTNPPELMASNWYDARGQLITTYVGGSDVSGERQGLQKVDYQYNIRGWLKSINKPEGLNIANEPDDLFAMKIVYDAPTEAQPLYNGNISETHWTTASDFVPRSYTYEYDAMNRLLDAIYQKTEVSTIANSYGERASYDKNGNILTMERNGELDDSSMVFNIDDLTYSYENKSNRLLKVTDDSFDTKGFKDDSNDVGDTSDDYEYDADGNLISDENKGIGIIYYNHLNLPLRITMNGGQQIDYVYNAAGVKVNKIVANGNEYHETDYLDGFQYLNGRLQFYSTAGGYINNTPAGNDDYLNYVFSFRDHLGNVRLNYAVDPKNGGLEILEENNYYPFGLKHNAYNYTYAQFKFDSTNGLLIGEAPVDEKANKYKYNGKEWQDELGLNMYAMDMRQYDPAIARWVVKDPVTHHNFSPYSAFDNNPVYLADPSGADASNDLTEESFIPYTDSAGNAVTWLDFLEMLGFKTSGGTPPNVGADGLTDDQWLEASRPNSEGVGDQYRAENSARESTTNTSDQEDPKKKSVEPELSEDQKAHRYIVRMSETFDLEALEAMIDVVTFTKGVGAPKVKTRILPLQKSNVNKIKNIDDLIRVAEPTFNKVLKHGEIQGFIKGDASSIFKAITKGGKVLPTGAVKMPDGTYIKLYESKSRELFELHINMPSQMYKIRVN